MYRKLLKKATNFIHPKTIGPLKREDDSLALLDVEKVALMNSYFSTIGEKFGDERPPPPPRSAQIPPPLSEINVSQGSVRKKSRIVKNKQVIWS